MQIIFIINNFNNLIEKIVYYLFYILFMYFFFFLSLIFVSYFFLFLESSKFSTDIETLNFDEIFKTIKKIYFLHCVFNDGDIFN